MTIEAPRGSQAQPPPSRPARRRPAALPVAVARQIARFAAPVRPELRRIVRTTAHADELLEVFPALAYALAIGHRGGATRSEVCALVRKGAPLKAVAAAAGLPMWLRRLPPEAFTSDLTDIPTDEGFARRVPARLPAIPFEAADWLEAVRFANRAASGDFALWVARHRLHARASHSHNRLALLAAYAWHSQNAGHPAAELVWNRWRPEMAPDTAICAAKSWFNRVLLCVRLPSGRAIDSWLEGGSVDGFDFVPLSDSDGLLREARAMCNCADQYAASLTQDRCRLFSVRRGSEHVATLEIVSHNRESGVLTIGQLKGRHNSPAGLVVWQAAYRWLATQRWLIQFPLPLSPRAPDNSVWRALMMPYRLARNGADWLPETAACEKLTDVEIGLSALAQEANIRSWLFVM